MTASITRLTAATSTTTNLRSGIRCKALRHAFDGHTYEERHPHSNLLVWVAKLECPHCGTVRIDFMTPIKCELISRRYFYQDDYPSDVDFHEAKQQFFAERLSK